MIFSNRAGASRPLHVLSAFTQISIAIALVVGLIEIKGIEEKPRCMFVTFLAMRIC